MLRKYACEQSINGSFLVQDYRGAASHFLTWPMTNGERSTPSAWSRKRWPRSSWTRSTCCRWSAAVTPMSNDGARNVLEQLSEIVTMARLQHLFIVDHTGHADKTRARGASGKEDWADILWNLQTSENNESRSLSVTGRGAQGGCSYAKNDAGQLEAGTTSGGGNPNNGVMIELGKAKTPLTVGELEALTGLSQSALSRALATLEEQGSAIRTPSRSGRAQTWRSTRST